MVQPFVILPAKSPELLLLAQWPRLIAGSPRDGYSLRWPSALSGAAFIAASTGWFG
jgi:hypothetical protein